MTEAEHSISYWVTASAHRMGVEAAHDPELSELHQYITPEQVLDRIEETQAQFAQEAATADEST